MITVNIELAPISSPAYESGPPGPEAIELARVVDRGIRESDVIPIKDPKLVVIPGKHVWILFVDIYIIDGGGNLIDASALAAMIDDYSFWLRTHIVEKRKQLISSCMRCKSCNSVDFKIYFYCFFLTIHNHFCLF